MLKGINDLFAAANLPASVVAEQATLQKITYASSDNVSFTIKLYKGKGISSSKSLLL